MRVLVACEFSGIVREAFRRRGHEVWSCDLLPAADGSPFHLQGDVIAWLYDPDEVRYDWRTGRRDAKRWDLLIAHPPCTHLAVSGAHRFKFKAREQAEALTFVRNLLDAPVPRIALENPIGIISTRIRKPDQIIQPYQFGHDASKRTCLWLKGLPLLQPTEAVAPRIVDGRPRWANQTDSGQNRLGPSPDRWAKRAETYRGIADAMASQWG
jgi:site-specific DNA-cytosine methylase